MMILVSFFLTEYSLQCRGIFVYVKDMVFLVIREVQHFSSLAHRLNPMKRMAV